MQRSRPLNGAARPSKVYLVAGLAVLGFGGCGLFDKEETAAGAELAPLVIDSVGAGFEEIPEDDAASGPVTRQNLRELAFSSRQADLFDPSTDTGYARVWSNETEGAFVQAVVLAVSSSTEASAIAENFVEDGLSGGGTPFEVTGVEGARGYRFEFGGFAAVAFARDDKVYILAADYDAGGAERLTELATTQAGRAESPPPVEDVEPASDESEDRTVQLLVAAVLAVAVLAGAGWALVSRREAA